MGDADTARAEVTLQCTAFNRSMLERTAVSGAKRLGLDLRVREAKRSLVRRDFTVEFWGPAESVAEFSDWLTDFREGRARDHHTGPGGPAGPG